jgi:hypothetical protein
VTSSAVRAHRLEPHDATFQSTVTALTSCVRVSTQLGVLPKRCRKHAMFSPPLCATLGSSRCPKDNRAFSRQRIVRGIKEPVKFNVGIFVGVFFYKIYNYYETLPGT